MASKSSNAVEVVVTARNEASSQLDKVVQDFQRTHRGATEMAQAIGSLNPLLSRTLFTLTDFAVATRNLDGALRLATIGFGAVVAAGAGFVAMVNSANERAARFQSTLNSWDMGRIRGEITSLTAELDKMAFAVARVQRDESTFGGFGRGVLDRVTSFAGLIASAPQAAGELLGLYDTPENQRAQLLSRLTPLLQLQGRQQQAELSGAAIGQTISRLGAQQGFAAQGGGFLSYEAIGRQIEEQARRQRDAQLEAIKIAEDVERAQRLAAGIPLDDLNKTFEGRRQVVQEQFSTGRTGRELAARTLSGQMFERYYGQIEEMAPGYGLEQISNPTTSPEALMAYQAGREARDRRDIDRLLQESTQGNELELGGGAEAVGVGPSAAETAKGIQEYSKRLVEARDLERELGEIRASNLALTKDETDALQKQNIELIRSRDLAAAGEDETKKALANRRADMAQFNLELARLQREDPRAGLAKGFADVTRGTGEVMQDLARNSANNARQAFDDLFFYPLTGQVKKLGDVGRSMGQAFARSFTGALADLVTGPALKGFSQLLSRRDGYGGLVAVPMAGGGTALIPAGSVDAATGAASGAIATPGGGGGILDLLTGGVGSFLQALGYTGIGGGSAGAVETAAFLAQGAAAGEASGGELALGASSLGATGAGLGLGQVLGIAGAGVGFLATLYSAYQTRSPGAGAATGAVGGLVSGATIGFTIGTAYPGIGNVVGTIVGGAIGLIVGAAGGAGAGAAGRKGGHRNVGSERRSAEAAAQAATNFSRALNQAQTGEDLVNILNAPWAPNGEFQIRATGRNGGDFTYADLFDPAIVGSITVAVGVTGSTAYSFELTESLKGKIAQIGQSEGGVLFSQREVAPGVARTQFLPFAAVARGAGNGGGFYFSTEDALGRGASPDQFASILRFIRNFRGANADMDLIPDLTAERFLQGT